MLQRGETGALSLHRRENGVAGAGERGLSATAGAALLFAAARRHGAGRLALGLTGAALVAHGVTGRPKAWGKSRSAATGVALIRAITIGARPEAIRSVGGDLSRWLTGTLVEAVKPVAQDRWRVVLRLPGGRHVETEVEVGAESDGTIAWRSVSGGALEHQGRVFFSEAPDRRGTEVRVVLSMRTASAAGAFVARALRAVADRALGHALARLKQVVETGEVATAEPQSSGRRGLVGRVARQLRAGGQAA
jgi:uncharacterized membrane protein